MPPLAVVENLSCNNDPNKLLHWAFGQLLGRKGLWLSGTVQLLSSDRLGSGVLIPLVLGERGRREQQVELEEVRVWLQVALAAATLGL